jgi:CRISPR-associated protein Csx17
MYEVVLCGCRPVPLASYLKALAVLRLISEQMDGAARGWWVGDVFVLHSRLDSAALGRFFLEDYRPTPIIAPWNGGSGFYQKDSTDALEAVCASNAQRFDEYRQVIIAARGILSELGIDEKVGKDDKLALLEACRGRLPDSALRWLDAAFVLTASSEVKYPPLLGTGGNDGRLEFTNNFMQRLVDVIDPASASPTPVSGELLRAALFDTPTDALGGGAIGQFSPAGAGGPNLGQGFGEDSLFNAWDFVLMMEGAIVFAGGSVRKLEHDTAGGLSAPFTVRASPAGYSSSSTIDGDRSQSRGEIWLPLWSRPASFLEVEVLFAEGRARVGTRTARNGVDFARAVATLGVDRGIDHLQRFGFHMRNGRNYLAAPLDRLDVRREPDAELLDEIDRWLDGPGGFRTAANGDRAPASVSRCVGRLDEAILDLCRRGGPDRVLALLVALGQCERMMARSFRWTIERRVEPVPPLSEGWLVRAADSTELRLASALASVRMNFEHPLRAQLEPIRMDFRTGRARWDEPALVNVAWRPGDLLATMIATFRRRVVLAERDHAPSWPDHGAGVALGDVAQFIEGAIDEAMLLDLLWGCVLVKTDAHASFRRRRLGGNDTAVPAFYALLKLCFPGHAAEHSVPIVPRIHRLASAGRGAQSAGAAIQRLRASGLAPAVRTLHLEREPARRAAAALLFPLDRLSLVDLASRVLRSTSKRAHDPLTAKGQT